MLPYDGAMRWAWVIAALIVASAVLVLAWSPREVLPAATMDAEGNEPVATVCPMPPEAVPAPVAKETAATTAPAAPAPTTALDSLLGGSLAPSAGASSGVAEVTVGPKAVMELLGDGAVRIDGRYVLRGAGTESDPYQEIGRAHV